MTSPSFLLQHTSGQCLNPDKSNNIFFNKCNINQDDNKYYLDDKNFIRHKTQINV
jgi:hypothetical protein